MSIKQVVLLLVLTLWCVDFLAGEGTEEHEDGPRPLPPDEEKKANCPTAEQLGAVCTCWATTFGGLYIECTGVESRGQLTSAFSTLSGQPMFGLGLLNSSLSHLPGGVLGGGLQALYLRHTRLAALRGPGLSPFDQVTHSLVHIDIVGEQSAWTWRWMDLGPLTKIRTLNLRDSDVRSLDRGVSLGLSPVRSLSFVNCQINHLTDLVFHSLRRLTSLDLSRNFISRLTRSMLPREAPDLVTVNLRHNQLRILEKDTFEGLHKLQVLDVGYNQLTSLDQAHFRPLLTSVKKHVYLAGNPLWCDCHLRWLVRHGRGENADLRSVAVGATCRRPLELEDRSLEGLRAQELAPCRDVA